MDLTIPALALQPIMSDQHRSFLARYRNSLGYPASFLQWPSWAGVKTDWSSRTVGWFDHHGAQVGSALILLRPIPHLSRFLAYIPEGPAIDWNPHQVQRWLDPLVTYLRHQKVFSIKMGPPVQTRTWQASTIKKTLSTAEAAPPPARLGDLASDGFDATGAGIAATLTSLGWKPSHAATAGFSAGQPQYVFQLPLAGKSEADILAGFNQQWRRNIKKAERSGVLVQEAQHDDLAAFHHIYTETAARDHFTARGLPYFQRMWHQLREENPDRLRLFLAYHHHQPVAGALTIQVADYVWYLYGASATAAREVRPSNALQWHIIRDCLARQVQVYDLRGITSTLDSTDPLFGLLQFKMGTGGQAVEYLGEWSFPLKPWLSRLVDSYLARR